MPLPAWVFDALIYAVLASFHILQIKQIKTGLLSARQYVFYNSLFSLPVLAALMIPELLHGMPSIHWTFWPLAAATAVIQCNGLRRSTEAFSKEEISLITPLGALVPILVGILSWLFLHQRLTAWDIAGIVIIVIGAYCIAVSGVDEEVSKKWLRPFKAFSDFRTFRVYMESKGIYVFFPLAFTPAIHSVSPKAPYFVATVIIGAMCVYSAPWQKEERSLDIEVMHDMLAGIRRGPVWREMLPWCRHLLRVVRHEEKPIKKETRGGWLVAAFALSAVIVAMQQYTEISAYNGGPTATVSALFKLDIPLSVLWGALFLHEKKAKIRVLMGCIIGAGVVVLTYGNRYQN
jgi:drug/metabolite transporter (DMT)-like permease